MTINELCFLLQLLDIDIAGPNETGEDPDNSTEVTYIPRLINDVLLVDIGEEDVHHYRENYHYHRDIDKRVV